MEAEAPPEFSRVVTLDAMTQPVIRFDIDATPGERAALARRFALVSASAVRFDGELRAGDPGTWRLSARITGDVVQTCVVTLEPLPAHVEERVEIVFAEDTAADRAVDLEVTLDDAEPLPPDRRLDLGEIAAQQLLLALPPFPRRPDAALPGGEDEPASGHRPFAGLAARLAGRDKPGGA